MYLSLPIPHALEEQLGGNAVSFLCVWGVMWVCGGRDVVVWGAWGGMGL